MMATSGLQAFATHRSLALQGLSGVIFLTNHQLAAVAEFAIALQDLILPDSDSELNGDERDGSLQAEDEFGIYGSGFDGPGCPVADPDFGAEEAGEPECGV
jgi:hypothetical protein